MIKMTRSTFLLWKLQPPPVLCQVQIAGLEAGLVNLLLKLTALDSRWEVCYCGHGSSDPMLKQCCLSVIFIPDPTNNNRRGGGKICCLTFFVPQISQNWKLFFLQFQEKWANWQSIIVLFTSTMFTMLSEIWVGDPVSAKNLSRIQGSKKHRIRNTVPKDCKFW